MILRYLSHNYVGKNRADHGSEDLGCKGYSGRNFRVLSKLEVLCQRNTLHDRVKPKEREVHVRHGTTGLQETAEHLHNRLYVALKSSQGRLRAKE